MVLTIALSRFAFTDFWAFALLRINNNNDFALGTYFKLPRCIEASAIKLGRLETGSRAFHLLLRTSASWHAHYSLIAIMYVPSDTMVEPSTDISIPLLRNKIILGEQSGLGGAAKNPRCVTATQSHIPVMIAVRASWADVPSKQFLMKAAGL